MRLSVMIDGMVYTVDSGNPRLIAAWLSEVFASVEWHPSTHCTVQAWPSPLGSVEEHGRTVSADWIMDGRYLGRQYPCKNPAELVKALQEALTEIDTGRA